MNNGSSADSGLSLVTKAFVAGGVALASICMLLLAPAVSADELICTVAENDGSHQYLVQIDDERHTVAVRRPKDDKAMPVTVAELTPERVLLGFNSLAFDPMKFVRQGKVVSLPLTINRVALIDRSTNRMIESGFVTDDKDELVSLEQIHAMKAEGEDYRKKHKDGPSHPDIFWVMFEVAIFQYPGTCEAAPPQPES